MNLSRHIAERALGCEWDDLDDATRHAARLCLADALVVMIGALRVEPSVKPFVTHARAYGAGPSTLLSGGTAPAIAAALVHGALAHALDFEDTYDAVGLHPNAAPIPVALALAEAEDCSLGDALTATALGADLACRIGLALAVDPGARGWYHPPMIGAMGAALAGAHVLKLTPDETVAALSLTQLQFAMTDAVKRSPASDLRAIRDGLAARAATEAVLLARQGVTGTKDPLAEQGGIIHLLTGAEPEPSAFDGFTSAFHTPDLSLKVWPCCRGTHPAVALALDLRKQGVGARDIRAVAFTQEPPDDMLFEPRADRLRPQNAIAAKFSIPFCFARTLLHGAPGLEAFEPASRRDPEVLEIADKVTLKACAPGAGRIAHLLFSDGRQQDIPLSPPPSRRAADTPFTALAPKMRDCLGASEDALNTLLSIENAAPSQPASDVMQRVAATPTF